MRGRWSSVLAAVLVAGCGVTGSTGETAGGGPGPSDRGPSDPGRRATSPPAPLTSSSAPDPPGSQAPQLTTGVAGVVRDETGAPIAGATVNRSSLDHPDQPLTLLVAVSDPAGRWSWQLEPGRWRISFAAPGMRPDTAVVDVAAGRVSTLDMVLHPA